jgi:hypothetical protein
MLRSLVPVLFSLLGAFLAMTAFAAEPIATFSIVGFDPETGELGVAVQSRFFAVVLRITTACRDPFSLMALPMSSQTRLT